MSSQLTQVSVNRHHRSNRSSRDLESSLDNPSTGDDLEENWEPVDSRENREKISTNTNQEPVSQYFSEVYIPRDEEVKDISVESVKEPKGNELGMKEESKQSVNVMKDDVSKNINEPIQYNKNVLENKNSNAMSPEEVAVKEANTFEILSKISNEWSPSSEGKYKETKEITASDPQGSNKVDGDNNKGSLEFSMHNNELKNANPVLGNPELQLINRDESEDIARNVTVKVFQFEHAFEPQDGSYTVSSIDLAVESRNSDDAGRGQNQSYSMKSKTSEGLSQEKLRLLLMNKIKLDKNDEKLLNTNTSCSDQNGLMKSQNKVRSLFNRDLNNKANETSQECAKASNETFSLKLSDGRSELNIAIVTHKPKAMDLDEVNSRKQCKHNGINEQLSSTMYCLKDIIDKLKQQTCTSEVTTPLVKCPTTTESCKTSTGKNDTDSLKAIENVVYKLVPIINSAKSSDVHAKTEKTNAVLKDQENETHTLYIEVKKQEDISPCANTSVSFNLSNVKISNETLPLPDYRVLKSKISSYVEPVHNFQTEIKSQLPQSQNGEPESLPAVRDGNRGIKKREASDKQIRGGQSCCTEGKTVPCSADPETYFESAHCLRFSDLW